MTEWIEKDRPMAAIKKVEELADKTSILLMEAYQEGKRADQREKAQWVVEEIKIAYDKGFKEGQTSALKSIEGANKKIFEG